MKCLIFLSLVAFVSASDSAQSHRVGSNRCTWGPSYWCATDANMQECGVSAAQCVGHPKAIVEPPRLRRIVDPPRRIVDPPRRIVDPPRPKSPKSVSSPVTEESSSTKPRRIVEPPRVLPIKIVDRPRRIVDPPKPTSAPIAASPETVEYSATKPIKIVDPPRRIVDPPRRIVDPPRRIIDTPKPPIASSPETVESSSTKPKKVVEPPTKLTVKLVRLPAPQDSQSATGPLPPPPGSDPCTEGPAFWCANTVNMQRCHVSAETCARYQNVENDPNMVLHIARVPLRLGANPCTDGPSFWCANTVNMRKCGVSPVTCARFRRATNDQKIALNIARVPLRLGANPCASGPAFWCENLANMRKCNVSPVTCARFRKATNVRNIALSIAKVPLPLGSNPCVEGPVYWCAKPSNMRECGVTAQGCRSYMSLLAKAILSQPGLVRNWS